MSGREHGHHPEPEGSPVQAPPGRVFPSDSGQVAGAHTPVTDELEVVPGFERENLQGWIPQLATETDVKAVIEKAFDYRGDVTVTRKDNSQITGYLFDRRIGPS